MNYRFHFIDLRGVLSLSAIFFIGIFLSSCKKDESINPSFESNTSSTFYTDSVEMHVRTVKEDSILSESTSLALFGAYKDSAFGTSRASFYTQVLLPFNGVNVVNPGDFSVDSVVLALVYGGKYGEEAQQEMEVFRLSEGFSSEKNYYSNDSLQFDPTPLAQKNFLSDIENADSIIVPQADGSLDTINILPQLRVLLDAALGTEILNQSPDGNLANNEVFTDFFKGLYVRPASTLPANNNEYNILYFALTNSQSKLSIYFTENSTQKKKVLDLPITTNSGRFNRYEHFYSSSPVSVSLQRNSDSAFTFLQSMSGVRPVLTFPSLKKQFPSSEKYLINKAELVLPVKNGSYKDLGLPDKLIVLTTDTAGKLIFTEDVSESSGYIDGEYDETQKVYRFNIARYLNSLINENIVDRGLTFVINGSAVNAERLILEGPQSTDRKMKLELYYSKIK